RGARRIDHDLADQPALQAELQSMLGRIYFRLGLYAQADALQRDAIALLQRDGAQAPLAARTLYERAETLAERGDFDTAARLADAAVAQLEAPAPPAELVRALCARATVEIDRRRFGDAARFARRALTIARAARADAGLLADTLLVAGNAAWGLPALDEAEADYRAALALPVASSGDDDIRRMRITENLVLVLNGKSRYVDALALAQQAAASSRALLGDEHPLTLRCVRELGLVQYHLGRYRDARATLAAVVDTQRRVLDADDPALAGSLVNYGLALADDGELGDAERAFAEAGHLWEQRYGHDYPGSITALGDLGYVHLLQRRIGEADRELGEAVALERRHGAPSAIEVARLGEIKRLAGDVGAARTLGREALGIAVRESGEASRFAALAHYDLALAQRDGGDSAAAAAELRAALASIDAYLPQVEHPLAANIRIDLADLLAGEPGALAERRTLLGAAVALRTAFFGVDDARTRDARARRAALPAD
ncbi:MAG TPA: tetratricopeptide repeat protein, partial [Dokdonella sp.]